MTIAESLIEGNFAEAGGGIEVLPRTMLTLSNSTLRGNIGSGGAGLEGGTVVITQSTLEANTAAATGGAVLTSTGALDVTNSTFSGNSADNGAGIAATIPPGGRQPRVHVSFSTFAGNTSDLGAGIWLANPDWEDMRINERRADADARAARRQPRPGRRQGQLSCARPAERSAPGGGGLRHRLGRGEWSGRPRHAGAHAARRRPPRCHEPSPRRPRPPAALARRRRAEGVRASGCKAA